MKRCSTCGVVKTLEEFTRHRKKPGGRDTRCKLCKANAERTARYGLPVEIYDWLLRVQSGRCAICGEPESVLGRRLAVDHDHATGHHRGLLCMRCNHLLGQARDNPAVLVAAIEYLRHWGDDIPKIAALL